MASLPLFRTGVIACGLAATLFTAATARADSFSFAGNLRTDATVTSCGQGCTLGSTNTDGDYAQFAAVVRSFTLADSANVAAVTFSYGGGTNALGQAIAEGGLEPYLSLFDASGAFIASTYSGVTCPAGANTNSGSGQCYDVRLDAGTLAAGTYQIALSAFANQSYAENSGAGTLADGFTDLGNLFPGEDLHYAFDVVTTASGTGTPPVTAVTPEPPSLLLTGTALCLVVFAASRMRQARREPAAT